jgi:hypothetical protein
MLPNPLISSAFQAALDSVARGITPVEEKTATMAGEHSSKYERKRELATMVDRASSVRAKLAPGGAGAGIRSASPSLRPAISAPGETSPLATTKLASIVASASITPESARAFWCAGVLHNLLMRYATKHFCSCITPSLDPWERMSYKAGSELAENIASDKLVVSSAPGVARRVASAMFLIVRKAAKTSCGGLFLEDKNGIIVATTLTACNGPRNAEPPGLC